MKADREILERAVAALAAQAAETDALVREAAELAGGSSPLTIHAKMIRQELLRVKAELERELERLELDCSACGRRVHWVSGLASAPATGRTGSPRRTAKRPVRGVGLEPTTYLGFNDNLPEEGYSVA